MENCSMDSMETIKNPAMPGAEKPRKILLLGATGSIGQQTLDVIRQHPDLFELTGVSAGRSEKKLKEIVEEFDTIRYAGLSKPEADGQKMEGQVSFGRKDVQLFTGEEQLEQLALQADYDILVNAVVGFRGLRPTLAALGRDKDVALANKESMVCGGELVKKALAASEGIITPIDSEHSAIFQCLQGNDRREVSRLIITASGGSLRNLKREDLENVSVAQVLAHPNWAMGQRITTDSASMVNKGFEVIEAHYLFDLPYEQIETVIHPESIVHSMVEFQDHAIIAQLGSADMHLPIQYALTAPHRLPLQEEKPLDLTRGAVLHFQEMDFDRFPILKTAIEAGKARGNRGCVFNAADEQAVALFLEEKISFLDIEKAIQHALDTVPQMENPSIEDLEESDKQAREAVLSLFGWTKSS